MKIEIVINRSYGGFGISVNGCRELLKRKGYKFKEVIEEFGDIVFLDENGDVFDCCFDRGSLKLRTDKDLIKLIKEKGSDYVSANYSKLVVVEVDINRPFIIEEYDGNECIKYQDDFDWIVLKGDKNEN